MLSDDATLLRLASGIGRFGCLLIATACARGAPQGEVRPIQPRWMQHCCSVLGIQLGENTLVDVVARNGRTPITTRDRDGVAEKVACYRAADGVLVELAAGPLGAWNVVTWYRIAKASSASKECGSLGANRRIDCPFSEGQCLGRSRADIIAALGRPTRSSEGSIGYELDEPALRRPGLDGGLQSFGRLTGIQFSLVSDQVTELLVYRLEESG
jgi:hypothetical protein